MIGLLDFWLIIDHLKTLDTYGTLRVRYILNVSDKSRNLRFREKTMKRVIISLGKGTGVTVFAGDLKLKDFNG